MSDPEGHWQFLYRRICCTSPDDDWNRSTPEGSPDGYTCILATYGPLRKVMREAIASSHLHLPIMALNPAKPVCLEQGLPVSVAIQAMYTHGIGSVLVLDGEILVGVFTEKDVLTRVLPRRHEMESAPLLEVMTQNPECLQQDDSIAYALNTMSVGRYRHVPLVDDYCRPSGVISVRDIFRYLEEVTRSNAVGPR